MNIVFRPWKMGDIESLIKHANNPNISKNMMNRFPNPYTSDDGKMFLEKVTSDNPYQVFAIVVDHEPVGAVGIFPQADIFSKNAELGYWLSESLWGKGIVTNAIRWITEYGFKTWDIDRIFARPFGTNLASQRVLEKSGFTLEGKFNKTIYKNGEYHDELVYAIRKP